MAIIFEMWAECAAEHDRVALVKHFDGFQCALLTLTGRTISWKARASSWLATGMTVFSDELSNSGVRNLHDALETTEAGLRLYHHLKSGPSFRFARIAWEAENIPLAELSDFVVPCMPGQCRLELECAMDESLYRQLGSPQFCSPFRVGYWWTRYRGEQYRPLYSNDQSGLNELCRSLFPEYFKY
jgi:hypothetical protein